jgi:hypothetical protein
MYKATRKASPTRRTIYENSTKLTKTIEDNTTTQICAERGFIWHLCKRREYKMKLIAPNIKAIGIQSRKLADDIR